LHTPIDYKGRRRTRLLQDDPVPVTMTQTCAIQGIHATLRQVVYQQRVAVCFPKAAQTRQFNPLQGIVERIAMVGSHARLSYRTLSPLVVEPVPDLGHREPQ
jgi:hypothetical protein